MAKYVPHLKREEYSDDRNRPAFVLNGARNILLRDFESQEGDQIVTGPKLQFYTNSVDTAEETKENRFDCAETPSQE